MNRSTKKPFPHSLPEGRLPSPWVSGRSAGADVRKGKYSEQTVWRWEVCTLSQAPSEGHTRI